MPDQHDRQDREHDELENARQLGLLYARGMAARPPDRGDDDREISADRGQTWRPARTVRRLPQTYLS